MTAPRHTPTPSTIDQAREHQRAAEARYPQSPTEARQRLDAGEQRSDAFLKINPLGAIPALVEKGHAPLTQSLAILEFLNEVTPKPPLLPADPYGRARVRSIAAALAADTHPLIVPRVKKYLTTTGGFDDEIGRAHV